MANASSPYSVEVPENAATVVDLLDHAAETQPDLTAIICDDDSITYRDYRHAAAVFAHDLVALGASGQRVVVLMGNSIEMSVAIHAIWAAGAACVLLNPLYTERELVPLIRDAAPCAVLTDGAAMEKVGPIAEAAGVANVLPFGAGGTPFGAWLSQDEKPLPEPRPKPDDLVSLQYTGGTTGLPKGAVHVHHELMHTVSQIVWAWPARAGQDIWCNVAPQFHIWGLCMTALAPVLSCSGLVLIRQFDPGVVLSAFENHGVTIFAGGPSPIYHALMGHPNFKTTDYSNLRICSGGGSPFAVETVNAWQAVTGHSICEGYGMSEGAPISLNPAGERNKVGTCGPPSPSTDVQVVDVETGNDLLAAGENGEIRVRGPQMMAGYWQRPDENAQAVRDGWVYTGDIGHLDEDGYIVIVDRKKDMAIVNGYNVFPREIDDVLFAHPDILEAAALGVPDEKLGEVIHAYVVPKAGSSVDERSVIEYCEGAMIRYKVPGRVFVVEDLPKTPARKVDKLALRERSVAGA